MKLLYSESRIERLIVIGSIISTSFLKRVRNLLVPKHLSVGYLQTILKWIYEYFNIYKKAPEQDILIIYEDKEHTIGKKEEREFITEVINDSIKEPSINEDYLFDKTKEYVKKRNLVLMSREINSLIEKNRLDDAQDKLNEFRMVSRQVSKWESPFDDPEFLFRIFNEDTTRELFTMAGDLGIFIGPLKRGWLLGILAPRKRGKSWSLQEIAVDAMMNRKKVAFITLEMGNEEVATRFYEELTTRGNEGKKYLIPIFDCKKNKLNTCKKRCRLGKCAISDDDVIRGEYEVCSVCRGNDSGDFDDDISYQEKYRPKLTRKSVKEALEKFNQMFGGRLYKQISLPAGIASLDDIESVLDELENEDFIPDVIILDYADILKGTSNQEDLDRVWIRLKGLASQKKCLVVTVSQSNRASEMKKSLGQKDTSKDIGKIDQVDIMLSLNQTEGEKNRGIIRVGCVAHRWKKFTQSLQVTVLQQLDLGRPMIDSLIQYVDSENNSEEV